MTLDRADVVVIGGGVMGASTAFHLAEAGVDVVLVERDELASGSTVKAAGGVRANFSDELNIALGLRSLEAFERFSERPGQDIDLHQPGYLFVLTAPEDVALFEASTALQNRMGVRSRMLEPREAKVLSPYLEIGDVLAAQFSPRDGHCAPESVVLGYAKGARAHGARVRTRTEVTGIEVRDGAIRAVRTTAGDIETRAVVDCAGAWSPAIAAMVGLDLPVQPVKREIVVTEPMADVPESLAFTIDFATSFYYHREGRGLLMGYSDPSTQPGFELGRSAGFLEGLADLALQRAPGVLDAGIRTGWAGLYEVTPDHNALLGEWDGVSRFLYATGFSGHGFLQGPAVGEILRDLLLGESPTIDVSPLRVERFAEGNLRPERNIV